jgi:hypothetical protein
VDVLGENGKGVIFTLKEDADCLLVLLEISQWNKNSSLNSLICYKRQK